MRENLKFLCLGLILSFACSCFYLQKVQNPELASIAVPEKFQDMEEYFDLFNGIETEGIFTQPDFVHDMNPDGSVRGPSAVFEFIHISDVQLRDERIQLFNRLLNSVADKIVNSVRFAKNQEKYDFSVFMCLLLGVNRYAKETADIKPAFLLHSGDSVHVSLMSEAWEFLSILERSLSEIPWFNVIGNHDVTVFGTPLFKGNAVIKNPDLSLQPINPPSDSKRFEAKGFISLHKAGETVISGLPFLSPIRKIQDLENYSPGAFDPSLTEYHGFDMLPSSYLKDKIQIKTLIEPEMKGYYAFDYTLNDKDRLEDIPEKIRVVVLNTCENVSTRAQGGITQEQVDWLREILKGLPNKKMRAIAFGHHPLIPNTGWMRKNGDQLSLLQQVQTLFKDRIDVYFCGHTHEQGYSDEYGFLQILAPSLISFPQSGHKVRLTYSLDSFQVEVIAFSHAEMPRLYLDGQQLDQIVRIWEKDPDILLAVDRIVRVWNENPNLNRRDICRLPHFWEKSKIVKSILDREIGYTEKVPMIKKAVYKAVLLKQAYRARISAMEDAGEENYMYLGKNYRFVFPLK